MLKLFKCMKVAPIIALDDYNCRGLRVSFGIADIHQLASMIDSLPLDISNRDSGSQMLVSSG